MSHQPSPVRLFFGGVVVWSLAMLIFAAVAGIQHDYIYYLEQWPLVLAGEDPWSTHNTYGPLHNALALLLPLGELAPKYLTATVTLAANALLVASLIRWAPRHWGPPNGWIYLYVIAVPANFVVVGLAFGFGLNDALVAALVVPAVVARYRGSFWMAGALLGVATLLKYYPLLFVPLFAMDNGRLRTAPFVSALIVIVAGLAVAIGIWSDDFLTSFHQNIGRGASGFSILAALELHPHLIGGSDVVGFLIRTNAAFVLVVGAAGIAVSFFLRLHWLEAAVAVFWMVLLTYKAGHQQFYVPWMFLVAALPLAATPSSIRLAWACLPTVILTSLLELVMFLDRTRSIIDPEASPLGFMTVPVGVFSLVWYFAGLRGSATEGTTTPRRVAIPLLALAMITVAAGVSMAWLHPGMIDRVERAALFRQSYTDGPADGTVRWSLAEDGAVQADVHFPEEGLSLVMSLSRNDDPTLPASHLVVVTAKATTAFIGGGVASVPGIALKPDPAKPGRPLAGAVADLGDGTFWVALSSPEPDRSNNLRLLAEWEVFELPFLDRNNEPGSVLFVKGRSGRQVFREALASAGSP